MKPAQRFQLKCRRASEAASRLGDWLNHNNALLGLGLSGVRDDLAGFSQRLLALAHAAEGAPGIGIVSTDAGAKFELLLGLVASGGQFSIAELGSRSLDPGTLRRLLPGADGAGGTAALRFNTGDAAPSPRGFPLKIVLLSTTDIAAVITKAATSALHETAPPPTAGDVEALLADVSGRLSSQAIPGLSEGDVVRLAETLNTLLPGHRTLASLASTRYWTTFREIAAHISDHDRQHVLSLLWGQDKAFNALFTRMVEGLAKFGHGGEAYCSAEALIGKDVSTGWITHHARSIIHASTLFDLAHPNGAMISVMNRFGQAVDVERAVLAGLIAEVPLHAAGGRLEALAPAELLDFPVPHLIGGPANSSGAANDDLSLAIAHFARAKAIYLVERACLGHELTSLIAAVDPLGSDDTFGPAIGDWVEFSQGATAHARRHVRCGLFVVAPAHDDGERRAEYSIGTGPSSDALAGLVGTGETWPTEWTPGRPFSNLYTLHRVQPQPSRSERRSAGGMTLAVAANPLISPNGSVIQDLAAALKPASEPHVRQVQLTQAFHEVRRRLNDSVIRHHHSNAPYALADWRRGVAHVLQDRIKFLQERRRLGHLIRALVPPEADIRAVIGEHAAPALPSGVEAARWLAHSAMPPLHVPTGTPISDADPRVAQCKADQAVEHWFRSMRKAARSSRFSRRLGVEARMVQNLVDELQLGALRTGLSGDIAQTFLAAGRDHGDGALDDDRRLAAIAHRLISAFLELPFERSAAAADRPVKLAGVDGEVADPGAAQYSSGGGIVRSSLPGSGARQLNVWDTGFVKLVEDNITSAGVVVNRSEKDRELGELIQLFASGPFEVEL